MTELAGLILVGIGVNTFMNGIWLLMYNAQNKRIEKLEKNFEDFLNNNFKKE